jgi:hypothetical protein
MATASTITRWRDQYASKYSVPVSVLRNFGDDVAMAMRDLVFAGKTPQAAYDVITNGLYAEERAIAANRRRRPKRNSRKRTSRKRTSRKRR